MIGSPVGVNRRLHQRSEVLVREFGALPAGTVLRCFARAVREAWLAGYDLAELPDVAEDHARVVLAARARPAAAAQDREGR